VVLYECVTGTPPFQADDAGELIRLHATAPVPDPRAACPGLSPTFAALIGKLLAKDPDDRYPSGESLLADLHRLRAEPDAKFEVGTVAGGADVPGQGALAGRVRELGEVANRWRRARAGRGGVVLVQGPPGVGKTRLAQELTASVRAGGHLVLHGTCEPDDPVPLAPLRAAVERYLREVDRLPEDERRLPDRAR
jgi:hypothetical protein